MKIDTKQVFRSGWFWAPALILAFNVLFWGSVFHFDLFEEEWRASLTDGERAHLVAMSRGLGEIARHGAPWPTFVQFKDGKVWLVFKDYHGQSLLAEGEVIPVFQGRLRKTFSVARIIYPNDPDHEKEKLKFFR